MTWLVWSLLFANNEMNECVFRVFLELCHSIFVNLSAYNYCTEVIRTNCGILKRYDNNLYANRPGMNSVMHGQCAL